MSASVEPRLEERRPGRGPLVSGLLVTLGNPKSAAFWVGLFLVSVPPHAPIWFHVTIVLIVGLQSALWYGTVAMLFSIERARSAHSRLSRRLDRIAGAVMIILGLRLAEDTRRELAIRLMS